VGAVGATTCYFFLVAFFLVAFFAAFFFAAIGSSSVVGVLRLAPGQGGAG